MNTDLADALTSYRDQLRPATPAPRRRGHRRWVVLAALTVVVGTGGLAAVVRPGDTPPAPGDAPRVVAAVPDRAPATTHSPVPSPAAAGNDPAGALPVAPPTVWRAWSSAVVATWLPTITGAGPVDPGRLAGFTRTPEGALAAAASLHPTIYYTRDRTDWAALADQRVVWADGQRAQLSTALEAVWEVADPAPVPMVPVGYRLLSYTDARAQLRLWWRWDFLDGTSPTVGALVEVVWHHGDWALSFDEPAMDMRALEPRDSYLTWGPA